MISGFEASKTWENIEIPICSLTLRSHQVAKSCSGLEEALMDKSNVLMGFQAPRPASCGSPMSGSRISLSCAGAVRTMAEGLAVMTILSPRMSLITPQTPISEVSVSTVADGKLTDSVEDSDNTMTVSSVDDSSVTPVKILRDHLQIPDDVCGLIADYVELEVVINAVTNIVYSPDLMTTSAAPVEADEEQSVILLCLCDGSPFECTQTVEASTIEISGEDQVSSDDGAVRDDSSQEVDDYISLFPAKKTFKKRSFWKRLFCCGSN